MREQAAGPTETLEQFEARKRDHVRIALTPQVQTEHLSQFHKIQLLHEALPEIDFSEVRLETEVFGYPVRAPLFVSSMTAGHEDAIKIYQLLAEACQEKNWFMGVGSQRKELSDPQAFQEWKKLRKIAPKTLILGNLGLSQVIQTPTEKIQKLVDDLGAIGLFVHTNPLQEALQAEGTPQFRGGLQALEKLCKALSVPVVLKEVGCGFSVPTLQRLKNLGLAAVDVSGAGGTHWGRIESLRNSDGFGEVFNDWGISTVETLMSIREISVSYQIWGSGGVRTGLDAAKLIALGCKMVGFAGPALQAATSGKMISWMEKIEKELKVALFCTGSSTLEKFQSKGVWTWE